MERTTTAISHPRLLTLAMGWFPDQPGGLTRYVRSLTEAMTRGVDQPPRIVVVGPAAHAPADVRPAGSSDQPLPRRLAHFVWTARRHARYAQLVDSHSCLYAFPCLLLPSVRRLPLVVHFHGPWAALGAAGGQQAGWKIKVKRGVERAIYRRAAAIIVLSSAFKDIVVEQFGIDAERVHVVPPGVDLTTFSPGDRDAARDMIGVPSSAWIVATARRLVPRMGLDVLLRAWAELDDPDRMLLIAGEGDARPQLESLVSQLGLEAYVRFLGTVTDEDLVACYRAADVSVVPSVALEGFGLVVLEALACGTPVIGTDAGGLPETLLRLDPSLVVPSRDPGALARRLERSRNAEQPLPAPADCRRFAESFSWSDSATSHWQLYAQVVAADASRRAGRP